MFCNTISEDGVLHRQFKGITAIRNEYSIIILITKSTFSSLILLGDNKTIALTPDKILKVILKSFIQSGYYRNNNELL